MLLCEICSALFASEEDEVHAKETQKERDEEKKRELARPPEFTCGNAPDRSERVHQPNTDSLRASVDAGCYVCTSVWQRLQHYGPEDIDQRTPITVCTLQAREEGGVGEDLGYFNVTRSLPFRQCEMMTHSLESFECIPLNRQDPDIGELNNNDTGSTDNWEIGFAMVARLPLHPSCLQ